MCPERWGTLGAELGLKNRHFDIGNGCVSSSNNSYRACVTRVMPGAEWCIVASVINPSDLGKMPKLGKCNTTAVRKIVRKIMPNSVNSLIKLLSWCYKIHWYLWKKITMIHMLLPVCGMMNFVLIMDLRRPKSFLVVGENGQARKKQRLLAVFGKGIRVTPTMCHPKRCLLTSGWNGPYSS